MSVGPDATPERLLRVRSEDGLWLRGRVWEAAEPRATLAYVHGIQSNSTWSQQLGSTLSADGISVYCVDRRGSGISDGPAGDAPDAMMLIDDLVRWIDHARDEARMPRLTIVGQSFGGSLLAAAVATGHFSSDRLVFCAPALGQQRARMDSAALGRARRRRENVYSALALKDTDYTSDDERLRFIRDDSSAIRHLTDRMRAVMVDLEDMYMCAPQWTAHPSVDLAVPDHDRIIDLTVARDVIDEKSSVREFQRFAPSSHFIEFGPQRESYARWLSDLCLGAS